MSAIDVDATQVAGRDRGDRSDQTSFRCIKFSTQVSTRHCKGARHMERTTAPVGVARASIKATGGRRTHHGRHTHTTHRHATHRTGGAHQQQMSTRPTRGTTPLVARSSLHRIALRGVQNLALRFSRLRASPLELRSCAHVPRTHDLSLSISPSPLTQPSQLCAVKARMANQACVRITAVRIARTHEAGIPA